MSRYVFFNSDAQDAKVLTVAKKTARSRGATVPLSAAEFIAAANQNSKITLKLVIRYLAGVLPSMRALHGTRVYQLAGALPDKKYGNEYLVLPCSEVVSG